MPFANPEEKKAYSKRRYEKRRQDAEAMERHRIEERERYRLKMEDPAFRERKKEAAKAQRLRDPERVKRTDRESKLRTMYGVEPEDFDRMMCEQGGACAICKIPKDETLHVDHCHSTKKVRGLLCSGCNLGIGKFDDDPERLDSAARYLRDSRA